MMIDQLIESLNSGSRLMMVVAAVVNIILALLLLSGSGRVEYDQTSTYRRSRRLSALSLFIFGVGFLVHWFFSPRATGGVVLATSLSLSYFHVGGVLFSMSHTSLVRPSYLTRKVVIRDVICLMVSLCSFAIAALTRSSIALHIGMFVTLTHLVCLATIFYRSFRHMYTLLAAQAEYTGRDNYTDVDIRPMYFSCHLIILFGLGSVIISSLVESTIWPYTLLLVLGVAVFSYIYHSLNNFGLIAPVAEADIRAAEAFVSTDEGQQFYKEYVARRRLNTPLSRFSIFSGFFRQW